MKLKTLLKVAPPIEEGTHEATLKSVKPRPDANDPKKILVGFISPPYPNEIFYDCPPSMALGKPLRKLAEIQLGRALTEREADEFDLDSLLSMPCQIIVGHKGAAGGRGHTPYVVGVKKSASQLTPS
jgi:hypothetical protein